MQNQYPQPINVRECFYIPVLPVDEPFTSQYTSGGRISYVNHVSQIYEGGLSGVKLASGLRECTQPHPW